MTRKTKQQDIREFLAGRYAADKVTDENVDMVVAALDAKGTTWTLMHPSHGYTEDQLSDAIKLVTAGMDNWKDPIDTVLPADVDRRLIGEAITFYTGSLDEWQELPDGRWRVTAAGYYMSVGS